jgi:hypothetical protein
MVYLALNNNHSLCMFFSYEVYLTSMEYNFVSKYLMYILYSIFQNIEDEIVKSHRDFNHISCMFYNIILLGTLLVVGTTLLVVYTV